MLGTCVGGAFALMAATRPLIRNRITFLGSYAPYYSMWTFARDIASATRSNGNGGEPWQVDPLTRKVFASSLAALLEPDKAERFRCAFAPEHKPFDHHGLSADGQAVLALLTAQDGDEAETAPHRLPLFMQELIGALSTAHVLQDLHFPLMFLLHNQGDGVIPVDESRHLRSALAGHAGIHYTEMRFQHLDPAKGRLPPFRLAWEFGKFFLAVLPLFQHTMAS